MKSSSTAAPRLERRVASLRRDDVCRIIDDVLAAGGAAWVRGGGHSMSPCIDAGDVVHVAPLERPIRRGDIVAVSVHRRLRVHRVVAITEGRVVTKGDACRGNDPAVPCASIVGVVHARRRDGRVTALRATTRFGTVALLRYASLRLRIELLRVRARVRHRSGRRRS